MDYNKLIEELMEYKKKIDNDPKVWAEIRRMEEEEAERNFKELVKNHLDIFVGR